MVRLWANLFSDMLCPCDTVIPLQTILQCLVARALRAYLQLLRLSSLRHSIPSASVQSLHNTRCTALPQQFSVFRCHWGNCSMYPNLSSIPCTKSYTFVTWENQSADQPSCQLTTSGPCSLQMRQQQTRLLLHSLGYQLVSERGLHFTEGDLAEVCSH